MERKVAVRAPAEKYALRTRLLKPIQEDPVQTDQFASLYRAAVSNRSKAALIRSPRRRGRAGMLEE
jgi:hypothetical protein